MSTLAEPITSDHRLRPGNSNELSAEAGDPEREVDREQGRGAMNGMATRLIKKASVIWAAAQAAHVAVRRAKS